MWHKNYDKIYLINLLCRPDRLQSATHELSGHGIPFEVVEAVPHINGSCGLYMTVLRLFEYAEKWDIGNILIFEDDVMFCVDNINGRLNDTIAELLKIDWDMLYLGANVQSVMNKVPDCNTLLQVQTMLATHAVAYSKNGWRKCLQAMRQVGMNEPIDIIFTKFVQPQGKCYLSKPMLAFQRPSYSNIVDQEMDSSAMLQKNFNTQLKCM